MRVKVEKGRHSLRVRAVDEAGNVGQAAEKSGKTPPKPAKIEDYFLDWRTWQPSDHRPMWVQLHANDSATYLEKKVFES